ncbi:Protein NPG1 [Camellia lanceoleosa]|uniref:Protein NPG1 n=1 Tax=Camellia lanceoleosa TaxID=1840588 RepID=A0ACC0IDZ1_9ERIC|nr:Protein NPG1 [Camellia lanceoleosa]
MEEDREVCGNGLCMKTTQLEAKLDQGNIHEAESSLQEGLSLNFEEARALLGRLEYQRGNVEGALRVFDGIDLQAAIQRLQPLAQRQPSKKGRLRTDSTHTISQHAASLVLEAIYLKAKSLQKLGRVTEAAHECKSVLDAVEKIFYHGILDVLVDNKLQEIVSHAVELLPKLWKQAGCNHEWNLENDCYARIQKGFAVSLLYGGVEAGPPSLAVQIDGSYVPRNNLEEAILLLMILMRKSYLGKIEWDPSVVEHLTFALSLCSQTSILAKQLEKAMPGVFHPVDRWKVMAFCYSGAGLNKVALNLLRKSLHNHEKPDDLTCLLLAAKICSEDTLLAVEGMGYAQRAIVNALGVNEHLKGVGLLILGLCLGKQSKVSSSDFERSHLQFEALKSLDGVIDLECNNSDLIFELGVHYAENQNLSAALHYSKQFIDATGGSILKGWRLLASAKVVTDAALDETSKWEQGPLLRMKAKLKIAQSLPMDAIETYRYLLALVQARRKSFGPLRSLPQIEDDKVNEFEVWHGLANLYSSLSRWKDAEICLEKARALFEYSAEMMHTEGIICEERGQIHKALAAYIRALLLEPGNVPCKVLIGAVLSKMGSKVLPVARSILSDALRIQPTNHMAWYYLGLVHRDDGQISDAIDCFQAASMLNESDPIESFSSIFN